MKKVNLQTQILNVLQSNPVYITIGQLAKEIHGISYNKRTRTILELQIRERMGAVCELAAANGITVFPIRTSKNAKRPENKTRIIAWGIFDVARIGVGEDYLIEVEYKNKIKDERVRSFKKTLNVAVGNNLFIPEKYKEIGG